MGKFSSTVGLRRFSKKLEFIIAFCTKQKAACNCITLIDEGALKDCTALTTINFAGTEAQWNATSKSKAKIGNGVTINFGK